MLFVLFVRSFTKKYSEKMFGVKSPMAISADEESAPPLIGVVPPTLIARADEMIE